MAGLVMPWMSARGSRHISPRQYPHVNATKTRTVTKNLAVTLGAALAET